MAYWILKRPEEGRLAPGRLRGPISLTRQQYLKSHPGELRGLILEPHVRLMLAHLGLMSGQVGLMLDHRGAMLSDPGLLLAYLRPMLVYLDANFVQLGANIVQHRSNMASISRAPEAKNLKEIKVFVRFQ